MPNGVANFATACSSANIHTEKGFSNLSQGLYMKHLLKHLTTPSLTIAEIFARLYSSFTKGKLPKMLLYHDAILNVSFIKTYKTNSSFNFYCRRRLQCFGLSKARGKAIHGAISARCPIKTIFMCKTAQTLFQYDKV